jgi:hypothetical protein
LEVEFQKDLEAPAFTSVLRLQSEFGLLPVIFPDLHTYLNEPDQPSNTLFQPSWVLRALSHLDASTEDRERIRENRILSLVLPLIEAQVTKSYSSLAEARKDPAGLKQFFTELKTPFPIPRREQERFKIYLIGWMRLIEFLEGMKRIPLGFQKKTYFDRVLQWHGFHQTLAGISEQETREKVGEAVKAGRVRRGRRPKRKRKKRLRDRRKPLDFS